MSKNFQLLQQTSKEEELFRGASNPTGPIVPAGHRPTPVQGKEVPEKASKGSGSPIRWPDLMKKGPRSWGQQIRARNNRRQTDLEAISREEEIKLVQRLFLATDHRSPQVVLFSGVEGEAGCASICARISEVLAAQAAGPVCVVDASLRSASLHDSFGVENGKGLAEAILESGPIQDFVQQISESNLWVMPSGFAAAQLSVPLVSDRLRARITELRTQFRYVVIHSAPLNLDSDPILLSRWTDGVVLVLEANSTRRETARRVKENLEVANVRVLGVVLHDRTFPIPEALYGRL